MKENKAKKANQKKIKDKELVEKKKMPKCVGEINRKFHHLVGEYKVKYAGPELSAQENEYLIQHWVFFQRIHSFSAHYQSWGWQIHCIQ